MRLFVVAIQSCSSVHPRTGVRSWQTSLPGSSTVCNKLRVREKYLIEDYSMHGAFNENEF